MWDEWKHVASALRWQGGSGLMDAFRVQRHQ